MNDINFWNDKEKADEVIKEASNIKSTIEKITIIIMWIKVFISKKVVDKGGILWQI